MTPEGALQYRPPPGKREEHAEESSGEASW